MERLLWLKVCYFQNSPTYPCPFQAQKKTFDILNSIVKDFLWDGKPPKFRKEIMEADIRFGGMKLYNLELFDKSLKIGWLKRYICQMSNQMPNGAVFQMTLNYTIFLNMVLTSLTE